MTSAGRSGTAPPAPGLWRGAWLLVDAAPPASVPTPLADTLRGVTAVGGLDADELVALVDGLPDEVDVVVLTDAAATTATGLEQARALIGDLAAAADAVVTVRAVTDALKRVAVDASGPPRAVASVSREGLVHPTWPQVVRRAPLRTAVAAGAALADVAAWLVDAGHRVRLRPVTTAAQERP
jgi:2-C-methyl-D-erythritol 4-phosphate cytidylyltransferase